MTEPGRTERSASGRRRVRSAPSTACAAPARFARRVVLAQPAIDAGQAAIADHARARRALRASSCLRPVPAMSAQPRSPTPTAS